MIYIKSFYKAIDFLDAGKYDWAVSIIAPAEDRLVWRGPNHFVSRFDDCEVESIVGPDGIRYVGPTIKQIECILDFVKISSIEGTIGMVHCTAGKSRSTAVTLGILYDAWYSAKAALDEVIAARALETDNLIVIPNRLIIKHLDEIFGTTDLSDVVNAHYEQLSKTVPLELITRGRHTIGD